MALPPRDQRHEWLRFDAQGYTEEEKQEFETRLGKINEGDVELDMTERLRMEHRGADGEVLFMSSIWRELLDLVNYWARIASDGDFLGPPPSYTLIGEPLRRLCHHLIAFTIQAKALTVEVRDLPTIDLEELIKLRIGERVMDTVSWFAEGPPRQQVGATGRDTQIDLEVPQDAPVGQEDDQPDPAPQQAPQMPQEAAAAL
ncbi:hypothetical protein Tco_0954147 [Tanacetum coccineum]|uniref:Uncharacterized protein n=1 Tax=Tanacetum coccineum TaxID=301880 RepID=A0ABQ5E202_9ASTR